MSATFVPLVRAVEKVPIDWIGEILRRPMARTAQKKQESFGERLARLRKAQGLTQAHLAERIGISRRMVAYYEGQSDRPPAHVLDPIASVLRVTADQLLGRHPAPEEIQAPFDVRVWRRLRIVEKLTPADRNAVIKYAEALARNANIKPDADNDH